jgi:hypothetical protein
MKVAKKAATYSAAILFTVVAGCSSSPDKISAAYVSPLQYQSYDCDQIRQELMRINSRVIEVTGQQQKTATKDAVAMGVGLVVFWPALFFLAAGEDKSAELGRLKGEYEALEKAAIEKKCSVATELQEAKRQREEAKKKTQEQYQQDAPKVH